MKIPNSKFQIPNSGFTLLEIIVALGVFMIVSTIALATLLGLTDAQRKAATIQNVYENMRFGLESMAKEIRTGQDYHCGLSDNDFDTSLRNCDLSSGGGPSLTFLNARGDIINYHLNAEGQLEKLVDGICPAEKQCGPLTSQEIQITGLTFYVSGTNETGVPDEKQPRVTILLQAKLGTRERTSTSINLQTTVSQRKLDS